MNNNIEFLDLLYDKIKAIAQIVEEYKSRIEKRQSKNELNTFVLKNNSFKHSKTVNSQNFGINELDNESVQMDIEVEYADDDVDIYNDYNQNENTNQISNTDPNTFNQNRSELKNKQVQEHINQNYLQTKLSSNHKVSEKINHSSMVELDIEEVDLEEINKDRLIKCDSDKGSIKDSSLECDTKNKDISNDISNSTKLKLNEKVEKFNQLANNIVFGNKSSDFKTEEQEDDQPNALEDSTCQCQDNMFSEQKMDRSKQKPLLDQYISKIEFDTDCYIIIDSSSNIVYFNKSFCDILLQQDEFDLLGKEFSFLMKMENSNQTIIQDMANELSKLEQNEDLTYQTRDFPFELALQDKYSNVSNFKMFTEYRKILDSKDEWNLQTIGRLVKVRISSSEHWLISPLSNIFFIWNAYILVLIGILMLLMPYSLVFDNEFVEFQEIVLQTFVIDILLTFNTSYEHETNGEMVVSRVEIAINYSKTWFILDLLSTIPFDRVFTTNSLDFLQYTKSIKVIAKTVRLAKLLRLTKAMNGNFLGAIQKNDSMREIIKLFQNQEGIQKMFVLICILLLICHQVCLLQLYIQLSFLSGTTANTFSTEYQYFMQLIQADNPHMSDMEVYSLTLMNHLLTALGYTSIPYFNYTELVMNAAWMLMGQCYQGYMLGEVCSFINVSNQADQELQMQLKTLDEICFTNQVDSRVRTKVTKDLVTNYDFNNVDIKQFENKLSKETYKVLERSIFKDFMDSFPVFKNLDIETLRFFKDVSILDFNTKVLRQMCELNEVFFITKGKFTIQQVTKEGVKVGDEQFENEIFGLKYFVRWYNDKYDKNINELVNLYTRKLNSNNDKQQINKNLSFSLENSISQDKQFLKSKVSQSKSISKIKSEKASGNFDVFSFKNALQNKITDKSLKSKNIKLTQNLMQNRDVEADPGSAYQRIQYKDLEEMANNSFKNFQEIFMYQFNSIEEISDDDQNFSIDEFEKFENNAKAGLIVSENGLIHQQNEKFIEQFQCDDNIKNNSLFKYIQLFKFNIPYQIKSMDELPLDMNEKLAFTYEDSNKTFHYQQNIKQIIRNDFNNKSMKKKKSMMKSQFLYFY